MKMDFIVNNKVDQTKRYGVKLTIISEMDSVDFENITAAIREIGYDIKMLENGNAVCEKTERAS